MSGSDHINIKEDFIQEQILLAAKQLFQQHGLRKVTMDDVAKAIGKGRSSLYYYYKSKEEIFDAVVDSEIGKMVAEITRAVGRVSTAEQQFHAFVLARLRVLEQRRSVFSTMDVGMDAAEMSDFNKARQAIHERVMALETALLDQVLTDGIAKGELHAMHPKEKDTIIFILLSSVHGLKREMIIENDFSQIDFLVEALTRMVMQGLKK